MSAVDDERAELRGWDATPAPEGEPVPVTAPRPAATTGTEAAATPPTRSFEEMLADPHEQFDGRSELLASIAAYAAAPPASAGIQPPAPAATTPEPATPGEAAFRHYMTGGDRPDLARQAWLSTSFEVRDRWEEVAGAGIAHAQPPGWVDQIRQDRDAFQSERDEALKRINALADDVEVLQDDNAALRQQLHGVPERIGTVAGGVARAIADERDRYRERLRQAEGDVARLQLELAEAGAMLGALLPGVLAAIDKFEENLAFSAPELLGMRIGQLRSMVRGILEPEDDEDHDDD